jgi:hypothetical protein
MKTRILFIILFCTITIGAWAQSDTLEIKDFYLDFATPEISAFSIMDIEPSAISKPGNIKEFALGITNFVNSKGDLKAGLAVEWAPLMTFDKKTGNWINKSGKQNKFEWKNITTSFATTNDSTNVKLSGALRFSPIDRTNPLNNKEWIDSISNYFYSVINQRDIQNQKLDKAKQNFTKRVIDTLIHIGVPMNLLDELSKPIDAAKTYRLNSLKAKYDTSGVLYDRNIISEDVFNDLKMSFDDNNLSGLFSQNQEKLKSLCLYFTDIFYQHHSGSSFQTEFNLHILKMKEDFKKKNWNKWALQLSGGGLFNSEKATLNDLKGKYYALAFSTGFPLIQKNWFKGTSFNSFLRNHSQILFQLKSVQYFTPDSITNNSLFFGTRVLLGNYDKRFSFEIAYIGFSNELTDIDSKGIRYSIGTEIKIMDNYWLELAVGGQNFKDETGLNILPTFAFRHAFGNENRYFK